VEPLLQRISALKDELTGGQLISVFVSRRVQPLQHRVLPMWQYTGPNDSTRCSPEEFSDGDLLTRVQQVTKCTSIGEESLVRPYSADLPLPHVLVLNFDSNLLITDVALICRIIVPC